MISTDIYKLEMKTFVGCFTKLLLNWIGLNYLKEIIAVFPKYRFNLYFKVFLDPDFYIRIQIVNTDSIYLFRNMKKKIYCIYRIILKLVVKVSRFWINGKQNCVKARIKTIILSKSSYISFQNIVLNL